MKELLKFTADWCSACKSVTPILEQIKKEHTDMKVRIIDVDKEPRVALEYQVTNLPTVIYLKDNVEISRLIGSKSIQHYRDMVS